MTTDRHHALDRFAELTGTTEPALWATRRALGESLRPGMQMSVYEGALAAWILKLHGAKRVVEVGSFVGLSALWLASALPSDGQLITLERDPAYAKHAHETVELCGESRIRVIETDALAYLKHRTEPFDALFIDGEKTLYPDCLEAALPHLRKGGLVLADNSLLFGAMLNEEPRARVGTAQREAMQRFHTLLSDKTRFDTTLIPTTEGLSVAVVK